MIMAIDVKYDTTAGVLSVVIREGYSMEVTSYLATRDGDSCAITSDRELDEGRCHIILGLWAHYNPPQSYYDERIAKYDALALSEEESEELLERDEKENGPYSKERDE